MRKNTHFSCSSASCAVNDVVRSVRSISVRTMDDCCCLCCYNAYIHTYAACIAFILCVYCTCLLILVFRYYSLALFQHDVWNFWFSLLVWSTDPALNHFYNRQIYSPFSKPDRSYVINQNTSLSLSHNIFHFKTGSFVIRTLFISLQKFMECF